MDEDTSTTHNVIKTVDNTQPSNTFQSQDKTESIATSQEQFFEPESRANLLNWKYLPYGQRLSLFEQKIPHVKDLDNKASDISKIADFNFELSNTQVVKDIIAFYASAKKRFIELSEEQDILKWHIANTSNEFKIKEGVLNKLDSDHFHLEEKLKTVTQDVKRYEEENKMLSDKLSDQRQVYEHMVQDATLYKEAVDERVTAEASFFQQLVENRKITHDERVSRLECRRFKQWRKLEREIALDNKIHLRAYNLQKNGERLLDAYHLLQTSLVRLRF